MPLTHGTDNLLVHSIPPDEGHVMTRRLRRLPALIATALVLAACSGTDMTTPEPTPGPTPSQPAAPADPAIPDDVPGELTVPVYLVRSTPTAFFVEPFPASVTTVGVDLSASVAAAVEALLDVMLPDDPDLSTSVPAGTTLRSVTVDGGIVTVDLAGAIVGSSGGSAQELTFAQQLAHTVRVDPSIEGVLLLIDGRPITELWGHLDWSEPQVADPFQLSPVTIEVPAIGAAIAPGELVVAGQATVFEATVLVSLLSDDGTVLVEDFVTATTGGPSRGTWTWTVPLPEAGTYLVRAGASDPSGGEGFPPFTVTRTVLVVG